MVEHLAKVAAIHRPAAHRASIKILGFAFGRIAHPTAAVPPARELNDRAVLFSHWLLQYENPARVFELRAGPAPQSHCPTAEQAEGSYSLPRRADNRKFGTVTRNRATEWHGIAMR